MPAVFDAWREVDKVTKYSYEIICSDDESSDTTVQVLESVKDLPVKVLKNKKGGASRARNAALEIAQGELVIFTGDDIFPSPDFINSHYESFLKFGPDVATLGRLDWHPDIKVNHLMKHITEIGCEQFGFIALPCYQFIDFRHFYTSNISVSRELLNKLDEYFSLDFDKYGFEDIELAYRLQKNGMRVYYNPDIFATHHHIYDSVDKFVNRQISAGEELVVFNHLHDDLEDKCIIDVDSCRESLHEFLKIRRSSFSLKGEIYWLGIRFAKFLAKKVDKYALKYAIAAKLASTLYFIIFQVAIRYGVIMRICDEEKIDINKGKMLAFLLDYLKSPFAELYMDIGRDFNEVDARKWFVYGKSTKCYTSELLPGTQKIRFAPMKDYCVADIHSISLEDAEGNELDYEIEWHNACKVKDNCYDFSHTNDSGIFISNIPVEARKFRIEYDVEKKRKMSDLLKSLKRPLSRVYRALRVKKSNSTNWDVDYAYGQRRRIQIGVKSALDAATKAELIEKYKNNVALFNVDVAICDYDHLEMGYTNYIYDPANEPLDPTQMIQVAYILLNQVVDYVVVSKTFDSFPNIGCKDISDVIVFQEGIQQRGRETFRNANGRFVRLPGFDVEESIQDISEVYDIEIQEGKYLSKDSSYRPLFRQSKRDFSFKSEKKVVFVDPIFLAVGGVERNTIETMRALKDEYDFCLLTMERHAKEQGSLHYQLEGICDYIFDMAECFEYDNFLSVLNELNEIFSPEILWLCNNSPWFEEHTAQVRKIFEQCAMVAQDVYDTELGWIEYYSLPHTKLFDRYIAITNIIKDTFEKKYSIPEQKISLIYSLIDGQKMKKQMDAGVSKSDICQKYNLDETKKHFAFVGRFTPQKNPLRLVRLAMEFASNSDIEFCMVGNGVLSDEVDKFINDNNVTNIVRIPYVANTPEFIGAMDGLIISSDYEGLPIVTIEAMCMSTPIFSTDVGDLKRFVEDNNSGLIIDTNKSDYDNFKTFLERYDEYAEGAAKNATKMLEFFSSERISRQYKEAFDLASIALKEKSSK